MPKKQKKKNSTWRSQHRRVRNSSVGYAKFRVLEHLHRLAEKLLVVKVIRERNVRARVCVCVCVCVLLR